jgi:hypothetical protein
MGPTPKPKKRKTWETQRKSPFWERFRGKTTIPRNILRVLRQKSRPGHGGVIALSHGHDYQNGI